MGKLTISRFALAMTISGLLIHPATPALAAPKWLQEMFTVDPPRSQKSSKPRRAKQSVARGAGNVIRLPATAPVPEPASRDQADTVAAPPSVTEAPDIAAPQPPLPDPALPETPVPNLAVSETAEPAPVEKQPETVQEGPTRETEAPYEEPFDNSPTEPPIPAFRPDLPRPEIAEPSPPAEPVPDIRTAEPPVPEFRPDKPDPTREGIATSDKAAPDAPSPPPDPRSAERSDPSGTLPAEELACRRRLTELGVEFEESKAETDPMGCSMPYPIVIKNLGRNIGIKPEAEMDCAMAEASVRFAQDKMSPAASEVFGAPLKSISHASAYVCRPRNGTRKLSEHAFGNALDIASFSIANGTVVAVEPTPPQKNASFLNTVREAACGPFKTVLGPGVPDHSEHLHFDLAPRRNGGTVCE